MREKELALTQTYLADFSMKNNQLSAKRAKM
jgi:hypothetical protein